MNILVEYFKLISLRLKWLFMTPLEKYAHFWAVTSKLNGGSALRYTAAIAHR